MKLEIWAIGKTTPDWLNAGIQEFLKRVQTFQSLDFVVFSDVKNAKSLRTDSLKAKEGEAILQKLQNDDLLVLFDDKGKSFSSETFALYLEKLRLSSKKRTVFLIGGAYGFSDEIYKRADFKVSLSSMTFSHQMIRLIAVEQIYRGFSILHNHPYHNP